MAIQSAQHPAPNPIAAELTAMQAIADHTETGP